MMRAGAICAALAAAWCVAISASTRAPQVAPLPEAEPSQQAQPLFKSASELVVLHVNVFDGHSDAVENLPQSAFTVLEDEQPQDITFFNSADVPVAVGLVVDNSGSMITRRSMVLAGATAFAESSHPEDELFTVVFNENVRLGLPDTLRYTHSRPLLMAGLMRYPPGGRTALFDAVITALAHLRDAPHQKRVLIVLSDGEDNASRHSKDEMLNAAMASDALIYTVAQQTFTGGSIGDAKVMRRLAEVSGGLAYFPESEKEVIESFAEIAGNIRRGYSIGYVPKVTADGKYRRVKVMVRMPGRTNLSARARHGYASPDSGSAQ
jgi:Ca-activated chloride channel homolog